jgi:hypothetical protein
MQPLFLGNERRFASAVRFTCTRTRSLLDQQADRKWFARYSAEKLAWDTFVSPSEKMARPARLELATLCLEACFDGSAIKEPILSPKDLIVPHRLLRFLRLVA